jgi:hypothetical protein
MTSARKRDRGALIRLRDELGDVSLSEALAKLNVARANGRPRWHGPDHDEVVFMFVEAIRQRMGFTGRAGVTKAQHCYANWTKGFSVNSIEKCYRRASKRVPPLSQSEFAHLSKLPRFGPFLKKIKPTAKTRAI